jgi:hypothetical protein
MLCVYLKLNINKNNLSTGERIVPSDAPSSFFSFEIPAVVEAEKEGAGERDARVTFSRDEVRLSRDDVEGIDEDEVEGVETRAEGDEDVLALPSLSLVLLLEDWGDDGEVVRGGFAEANEGVDAKEEEDGVRSFAL